MASTCFILLLALVAAALGQSTTTTEVAPTTAAPPVQPEKECSSPGRICSTCTEVGVCVANGLGVFEKLRQPCQEGEMCVGGDCVKGAFCNYREFQVSEPGVFPDPYDCQAYHYGLPTGDSVTTLTFRCEGPTSYQIKTQDCTANLTSDACSFGPVPECLSRLQMGSVTGDPSLYYICIQKDGTIAPELRRCPAGRVFDSDTVTCQDPTTSSSKDKKKKKKSKA